jgi:hypothetical protein
VLASRLVLSIRRASPLGRKSVSLALALCLVLVARSALADSPFEGKWTQGPLKEDYTVLKWQKECDAAPVNGSSGGGESVSVHAEGDELSFVGGGRVFKTNQCYDQMPTLSRESHTRNPSGREWRTRCATPPSDPRRAVINTLVVASSDTRIDIIETGRYEITLAGGLCTADVKRSRSFELVQRDNPTAPVAPPPVATTQKPPDRPTPATPEPSRCTSPGEPSRLEARPSRKLLRTGESFAFHALVLDASGCATRTSTSWALDDRAAQSNAISVDGSGLVTVAPTAAEGTYDVVVTAAGKSTRVTVEVASPLRYDSLLAQSGLNDAGENDTAAVVMIAAAQLGGSDARAEDGSERRRTIFLSIVGLLSVALLVVAVVATRRSRKAAELEKEAEDRHADKLAAREARRREKAAEHAAAMRAHEESVERAKKAEAEATATSMTCPTCRREFAAGSTFCPNDATKLVPHGASQSPEPGPGGSICPTCKRGFEPGIKVCPHDKDELVPYALYASRAPDAAGEPAPRGKICPTCGSRFEGRVEFCGKDGTALVLLN